MKPRTLHEAVSTIRAEFPVSELDEWAAEPEHVALALAHFGLGVWIRNQWVHGNGSPLANKIMKQAVLSHEDSASSLICTALWRVLNGHPCPTVQELLASDQSTGRR